MEKLHFVFLCVPCSCCFVQSETEWQHFLRQCLEVVAKVAELTTAETFQAIVSLKSLVWVLCRKSTLSTLLLFLSLKHFHCMIELAVQSMICTGWAIYEWAFLYIFKRFGECKVIKHFSSCFSSITNMFWPILCGPGCVPVSIGNQNKSVICISSSCHPHRVRSGQ